VVGPRQHEWPCALHEPQHKGIRAVSDWIGLPSCILWWAASIHVTSNGGASCKMHQLASNMVWQLALEAVLVSIKLSCALSKSAFLLLWCVVVCVRVYGCVCVTYSKAPMPACRPSCQPTSMPMAMLLTGTASGTVCWTWPPTAAALWLTDGMSQSSLSRSCLQEHVEVIASCGQG